MAKNIKVKLKCTNIAPLENLDNEFENTSLKIGVFANNGCGKTFISRMFRLLEKNSYDSASEDKSTDNTDRLITLGKSNVSFGFGVKNETRVMEDFSINLKSFEKPTIPSTKYLYHTFNQDYVDDNIRGCQLFLERGVIDVDIDIENGSYYGFCKPDRQCASSRSSCIPTSCPIPCITSR